MTSHHAGGDSAARIREKLGHPVIDGDGHIIESESVFLDYLKQVAGADTVGDYVQWVKSRVSASFYANAQERIARRIHRGPFWGLPANNTIDRATSMFPGLMYSRLDELGIDVSMAYPTMGLLLLNTHPDLKRACIRSTNTMNAELYRPFSDRLIPVAVVPMQTPEEAIEEMEFAVNELGMKAIVAQGSIQRPIPEELRVGPGSYYVDFLALDSVYDYDPVWQKCIDLGVALTGHSGAQGQPMRSSPTSFVFNHVGHFGAHHEGQAKALLLGGVTRRFPKLKIAFLEGGVGWAVNLYNQIFEHFEKRNIEALKRNQDPSLVDRELLVKLALEYGEDRHKANVNQTRHGEGEFWALTQWPDEPIDMDEFKACGAKTQQDLHDLFVPNFYFGCEADDRLVASAFNPRLNVLGARLQAIFSSDIGHWDVIDATRCVPESYELVEEGLLSAADYRDFMFSNAVKLHGSMNPDFFKGTIIEADASRVLAKQGLGGVAEGKKNPANAG